MFPCEIKKQKSPKILFHDLFTNKIAYTQMCFNTDRVPQDQQATLDVALVERKIARHADRRTAYSIKFHDPRFLRVADYNYIIAPRRVVRRA